MDRENQFDYLESQSIPKQPTHEEYVQDKPTETLQESDFNIIPNDDPTLFSQAISEDNSTLGSMLSRKRWNP